MDMTYTSSREEAGATWSNNVNCRTTFEKGTTIKARLFLGDVHSITTTLQNAQ